jgi:hypothetical protein
MEDVSYLPLAHRPRTAGGLLKRAHIRRFTAEFFNAANDHNPKVARTCPKCGGRGFNRVVVAPDTPGVEIDSLLPGEPVRQDITCDRCGGQGALEEAEPYFARGSWFRKKAAPNDAGYVRCPACKKLFPVRSNQFWSGLRHACGQKLKLVGPNAGKCWTRGASGAAAP